MTQRVLWVQTEGISRHCAKLEQLIGQVDSDGEVIDRIVSVSATHEPISTGDWWISVVVVETHSRYNDR